MKSKDTPVTENIELNELLRGRNKLIKKVELVSTSGESYLSVTFRQFTDRTYTDKEQLTRKFNFSGFDAAREAMIAMRGITRGQKEVIRREP